MFTSGTLDNISKTETAKISVTAVLCCGPENLYDKSDKSLILYAVFGLVKSLA